MDGLQDYRVWVRSILALVTVNPVGAVGAPVRNLRLHEPVEDLVALGAEAKDQLNELLQRFLCGHVIEYPESQSV